MIRYESFQNDKNNDIIEHLCYTTGINRIIIEILLNRGIDTTEKIQRFMQPNVADLNDPYMLVDMERAVNRIKKAIDESEKITIYGDYDVDGVTSTSILLLYLQSRGTNIDFYIPSRHEEGYGLNSSAIQLIASNGTQLLITVDCGITAHAEVVLANEIGMDVIITDHHECGESLPPAFAVVNPKRKDQNYPFPSLAGVGVAAKLIQALGGIEELDNYLDLIAIGTISDIVPLIEENRIFVKKGIEIIHNKPRIGIDALIKIAGYEKLTLESGHIAFGIGPRINAGGRIGHSSRSVLLLTTVDTTVAENISYELDEENKERQDLENLILEETLQMIENKVNLRQDRVIILSHKEWHHGVIGIVASRLTERFYRPVILLSEDGDIASGSGRSIPNVNLFDSLLTCKDMFIRFGGHEQAAGLSLAINKIDDLRRSLNNYLKMHYPSDVFIPCIKYDKVINLSDFQISLIHSMMDLQPFGMGNPTPSFCIKNVKLDTPRAIGKNVNHLKVRLKDTNEVRDGIGFKMGYLTDSINENSFYDIIANAVINEWNGVTTVQCNIKSLKNTISFEYLNKAICENYDKLCSAFWEQIIYNNGIPKGFSDSLQIVENPNEGDQLVVGLLKNSIQGTLILVQTPEGLKRIIKLMNDNKLFEWADFSFGIIPDDPFDYNVVAAGIKPDDIIYSNYQRIIFYDGLINPSIIFSLKKESAWVIMGNRETNDMRSLLDNMVFSRDDLAKYYRMFLHIFQQHSVFINLKEFMTAFKKNAFFYADEWKIRFALTVFSELGFLNYEDSSRFRLCLHTTKGKKDLLESPSYKRLFVLNQDYNHYIKDIKNILLGGN